jgi:hypothetical protein
LRQSLMYYFLFVVVDALVSSSCLDVVGCRQGCRRSLHVKVAFSCCVRATRY